MLHAVMVLLFSGPDHTNEGAAVASKNDGGALILMVEKLLVG